MARYIDPTGTAFWEIEREGATIVRRSGKLGTAGRPLTTTYPNGLVARFHYGHFVGVKTTTEKYQLESSPVRTIDFPYDDDARLVHADALQQRGDPMGELIVLQHRGVDTSALIEQHAARWLGDLADARELFELEWHLGRVRSAKLVDDLERLPALFGDVPARYWVGTLFEALFELDVACFLEELVFGAHDSSDNRWIKIAERAPPTLRRIELVRGKRPRGPSYLTPLQLPTVEELDLNLNLSTLALEHLARASWPKLRSLSFAIAGSDDSDLPPLPRVAEERLAALAPLFAGAKVPALRHLEIWTPSPSQLARALATAPLTDQLSELVIRSRRSCDPEALAALRARKPNACYEQMPLYSMRPY